MTDSLAAGKRCNRMLLFRPVAVMMMVGLLGAVGIASAAPVLDQSNPGTSSFHNFGKIGTTTQYTLAQTFTAGLTGQLTGVDVYVTKKGIPTEPLVIDIQGTIGGVPDAGNVLASVSIDQSSVSTTVPLISIDLTPFSVLATAGTQYAIQFFSDNDFVGNVNQYTLWRGGNYSGGSAWTNDGVLGSPPTTPYTSVSDWGFRTYVDVEVTEPGTLGLISAGLIALYRRRRQRA